MRIIEFFLPPLYIDEERFKTMPVKGEKQEKGYYNVINRSKFQHNFLRSSWWRRSCVVPTPVLDKKN